MSEIKILLVQLLAKDQKELMVIPDDKLLLKLNFARELVQLYETLTPCKCYCRLLRIRSVISSAYLVFFLFTR